AGVAVGGLDGDGGPEIVTTIGANVGGTFSAVIVPVELAATHIGVASASPWALYQGSTRDVVLTGTGFKDGDAADFGPGIAVNQTTATSPTSLTVNVTVSPIATVGFRNVTVTHSDGGHGKAWSAVTVIPNGAAT